MNVHAEDPCQRTPYAADRGARIAVGDRVADAMSAHAEDPFQVTPHAANRGVGVADVDQVPMP